MSAMAILKSSDGEMFELEKPVALMSNVLKLSIEIDERDGITNLISMVSVDVSSKILKLVKDFCEFHHSHSAAAADSVEIWCAATNFVTPLIADPPTLFALAVAALYLDICTLLDFTCQTIANMIKGKTLGEIRRIFDIENDLSPFEEETLKVIDSIHKS